MNSPAHRAELVLGVCHEGFGLRRHFLTHSRQGTNGQPARAGDLSIFEKFADVAARIRAYGEEIARRWPRVVSAIAEYRRLRAMPRSTQSDPGPPRAECDPLYDPRDHDLFAALDALDADPSVTGWRMVKSEPCDFEDDWGLWLQAWRGSEGRPVPSPDDVESVGLLMVAGEGAVLAYSGALLDSYKK